ncbi:HEPN domain-containing protein [Thiococcus pfennigii]|uniref:HEPN domain-containing protein n=1 Tax=Thiococcus pfennigii TaxID=1057 RepID=UPI001908E647|nr:HEPN domain-containing protein [Thiococcus pfennigii]MBK1699959.1 hypothetical protein [Thiococcus pfennigii]
MPDPSTCEAWLDVARERGADARAMLPARAASIGPVYMAGYAVESALKAYLQAQGLPRPAAGPAGHDLRALWKASGLQLRDLKDPDGTAAFFVQDWTTALRYQAQTAPGQADAQTLVDAAGRLLGYLSTQIKRQV